MNKSSPLLPVKFFRLLYIDSFTILLYLFTITNISIIFMDANTDFYPFCSSPSSLVINRFFSLTLTLVYSLHQRRKYSWKIRKSIVHLSMLQKFAKSKSFTPSVPVWTSLGGKEESKTILGLLFFARRNIPPVPGSMLISLSLLGLLHQVTLTLCMTLRAGHVWCLLFWVRDTVLNVCICV